MRTYVSCSDIKGSISKLLCPEGTCQLNCTVVILPSSNLLCVPLALKMNKTVFPATTDLRPNLQKTPMLVNSLLQLAACSGSAVLIIDIP